MVGDREGEEGEIEEASGSPWARVIESTGRMKSGLEGRGRQDIEWSVKVELSPRCRWNVVIDVGVILRMGVISEWDGKIIRDG